MGKPRNVHTTPNRSGSGWVNTVQGTIVSTHRRKDTAVQAGREIARSNQSEHYIHNTDGRITRANSYGNDPLPPRDKNR